MLFKVLAGIFLLQIFVIVGIVVVLKKVLDDILIEDTLQKCLFFLSHQKGEKSLPLELILPKPPGPSVLKKLQPLLHQAARSQLTVSFVYDAALLGGMCVTIGTTRMDGSLRLRLKESGFLAFLTKGSSKK